MGVHPSQRSPTEYIPEIQKRSNQMRGQPQSQKTKTEWRVQLDGSDVLLKLDGIEFDATSERYHSLSKPKSSNTCREVCNNGVVCGKRYQRREHLARHALSHSRIKKFRCKICNRPFSRNDNRNDHYWTHVHRPGTRNRNRRLSLEQVLRAVSTENPNVAARLIERWESEVLNVG
ncbi:hypothetical protein BDV96DRAFT_577916 [Lophiotrema nucula]|uniref:C2H2-type domain-containing protein n=1 Tax=Lophiotrema nucula TaxID=690887 RepID=A0A6A5Z3D5_9PLEO|nr:hypothetical protein BDV96DRAFT_577916 [Lophiotrema nucula]